MTLWMSKSIHWIQRYSNIFFWSQLICTVTTDLTSRLDWPQKTTPKWLFECQNPSTGSKDTVIFVFKSADLYSHIWSDLTIGLALKNYPKMTLWMSKSVHWIKRYSEIYFQVSWFVQSYLIWPHDWIGLEKLPQNDTLNVQIHPLDQKIQYLVGVLEQLCHFLVSSLRAILKRKVIPCLRG